MSSIDESKDFVPLNIAVLTISDTRSLADDKSGTVLSERLVAAGHVLAAREIIVDDVDAIRIIVRRWIADPGVDVVITTGGTGFTGRDVTPEAIEPLFEKRMDGFSIAFHMLSHAKIGTSTIQSRTRPCNFVEIMPRLDEHLRRPKAKGASA
jgi:molybdenum cofactor biosynthesis protein B